MNRSQRDRYWTVGIMVAALVALVLILSGCQTPLVPPPTIVRVPVGISCLPQTLPVRPQITTEEALAAKDDFQLTLALFADRRALLDYTGELEAVIGACR